MRNLTCEIKVELGLGGVEKWTQPTIPLSLPWKTLRQLTPLPEQSENQNSGPTPPFHQQGNGLEM